MRSTFIQNLFIASAALMLVACEGATVINTPNTGTTPPTEPPTTGTGGTTIPPQVPATLRFTASPSIELPSNADQQGEGVVLTATALDARNVVMQGAAVTFSSSGINQSNPGQLFVPQPITDANGQAKAVITTGEDSSSRSFTVTATAGGVSRTLTINVVGTVLSIAGPDTLGFGAKRPYTVTLLDAAGAGIGGQTVTIRSSNDNTLTEARETGTGPVIATLITAPGSGQARFDVTTTVNSPDVLIATALGTTGVRAFTVSQDAFTLTPPAVVPPATVSEIALDDPSTIPVESAPITIRWLRAGVAEPGRTITFSTTRGAVSPASAVTDANGRATFTVSSSNAGPALISARTQALTRPETTIPVEFVANKPDRMNIQVDPFVVPINGESQITATVRDINDNLVKNQFVEFNITDVSRGELVETSATTNSFGQASVTFRASNIASQSDGVRIEGRVSGTTVTAFRNFTVGASALRLLLGTGNDLVEDGSPPTRYKLPYSVQVTDSAGDGVPDATFSLKLRALTYAKGFYLSVNNDNDLGDDEWQPFYTAVCANEDLDLDGEMDGNGDKDCDGILDAGEDVNGNGTLDRGEDLNGDCILTPSTPASVPPSVGLGPEGTGQFDITYPQDHANWAAVELRGIARVAGTETIEAVRFRLIPSAADIFNLLASPPGFISPYGSGSFAFVCERFGADGASCIEGRDFPSGTVDTNPFDGSVDPDCFNPF